jgi:hypothetical protein
LTDISCPLIVEVLNSERGALGLFRLHAPFTAITDAAGTITVDLGYTTDLASIPRIARWLIPQAGHSARAAVLHDWLLHQNASHSECTKVFNEVLKAGGTGPIRRWIMVAFVWLFTLKAPDTIKIGPFHV